MFLYFIIAICVASFIFSMWKKHQYYESVVTVSVCVFLISAITFLVGVDNYAKQVSASYNIDDKIVIAEAQLGFLNTDL